MRDTKKSRHEVTRRRFLERSLAAGTALTFGAGRETWAETGKPGKGGIRRLSKEVFIPAKNGAGVFPGFITYVHKEKPVLLHRFGWVDASDTYDRFHDSFSHDNGKTWSEPVLRLAAKEVEGGRLRYVENGAFFDPDAEKFITVVSKIFYPKDTFSQDQPRQLEINVYDPLSGTIPEPETFDFGLPGGMGCSFCFPLRTAQGHIVIPGFKAQAAPDGSFPHHPKSNSTIYEVRMVIGTYQPEGKLTWRLGQPLRADNETSTRGFSECAVTPLKDGRLAALCRGSNAGLPEQPGYKWLAFSKDDGETWSTPSPLLCGDGRPIESSATGCACFRSIKNGKLYFIGNICLPGEHADGNWPRSPLYIAEMQEDPFALRRDTIAVVDERQPGDSPQTQISNFRYYQDRETGDVVIFATRFGERDAKQWKNADYYRYRMAIE